jgi:hypothetical protein
MNIKNYFCYILQVAITLQTIHYEIKEYCISIISNNIRWNDFLPHFRK